jgi:hypothetical protein
MEVRCESLSLPPCNVIRRPSGSPPYISLLIGRSEGRGYDRLDPYTKHLVDGFPLWVPGLLFLDHINGRRGAPSDPQWMAVNAEPSWPRSSTKDLPSCLEPRFLSRFP